MASSERGTKRTDPETGKKFYDLNLDPIVSPYTGKSYPRSYFEQLLASKPAPVTARKPAADEDEEEVEDEVEDVAAPEIVSLEDADAEESGDEEIPDVEDVEVDEELGEDEADVFLEEDEDEDAELGFDVGGDEDR
ncbi:TIGR02300 family protein [Devosia sp. A369]